MASENNEIVVKHSGNSVIIVNQTNQTQQTNTFQYTFPSGSVKFAGRQLAISSIIIPYSWYNISTNYLNNTLSLVFPVTNGSATSTINLTIPNGFYSVTQLNQYLQSQMIANNFYLVNGSGNNVYYLDIVANPTQNTAQIDTYVVPNTLPGGYTNPGWTLPSTGTRTPQVVISNQAFGNLIGFNTGSYPASMTQTGTYSITSQFTPQISPVSSVLVGCSLINNVLSSPSNIIANIPITSTFGTQIIYNPNEFIWVPVLDGSYPYFKIQFYDQAGNLLPMTDTGVVITMIIK